MSVQSVDEGFRPLTVQEVWNWAQTPLMVAQIDDRGDVVGLQKKEDLPGLTTCRCVILIHCIQHPKDEVGFAALHPDDQDELTRLRQEHAAKNKKSRRRKK